MDFGLFYFAADEGIATTSKYHLLIEGAKFGDQHGFSAVWTPERHFHPFGGLYPNPSVTSAAAAAVTSRIHLRAGSVVLPLHDPIRVAEEWSVVDNISGGRVGISIASGWLPNDYVLMPECFFDRKGVMLRGIDTLRRLWRGETIRRQNGKHEEVDVRILPRPIQAELPIWVTAAGNPETFRLAGQLTHLLNQRVEDLKEKIAIYRESWCQHANGPGVGHVALMVHTFVGQNSADVRDVVYNPFTAYLASSIDLMSGAARDLGIAKTISDFTKEDTQELLDFAFNRYFGTSALFGTPQTCLSMVHRLQSIGVDELACLIDFGVDPQTVLEHLQDLDALRELTLDGVGGEPSMTLPVSLTGYTKAIAPGGEFATEMGAQVEAALLLYPDISSCAVTNLPEHAGTTPLLVAHIVLRSTQGVTETVLNDFLRKHLPQAALPSRYIFLSALPLSINGKVDRRALSGIGDTGVVLEHHRGSGSATAQLTSSEEARTDLHIGGNLPIVTNAGVGQEQALEEIIAALWSHVLDVKNVSAADDFFDMGGDSLIAMRLLESIHDMFGIQLPLATIFEAPTPLAMCTTILQHLASTMSIEEMDNLLISCPK